MQVCSSDGLARASVSLHLGQELQENWGPFGFYILAITQPSLRCISSTYISVQLPLINDWLPSRQS